MMGYVDEGYIFADIGEYEENPSYNILFSRRFTVREFIQEILKRDEWGYIGIENEDGHNWFGDPCCMYKYSELEGTLPDEIMKKSIQTAKATGRWGRMDYLFTV